MTVNFNKLLDFIKEYAYLIAAIGGVLFILNLTGFSINIPEFYSSLNTDGKIAFVGVINLLITILAMLVILRIISKRIEKNE